jgi:hypothetical protein
MTAFVTKAAEDAMTEAFLAEFERRGARLAEAERLLAGAHYHKSCAKVSEDEWWAAYHEFFATADSADDDPYRRAAQQSLDAEREGLARARADGTAERAVDDLLKILGK